MPKLKNLSFNWFQFCALHSQCKIKFPIFLVIIKCIVVCNCLVYFRFFVNFFVYVVPSLTSCNCINQPKTTWKCSYFSNFDKNSHKNVLNNIFACFNIFNFAINKCHKWSIHCLKHFIKRSVITISVF